MKTRIQRIVSVIKWNVFILLILTLLTETFLRLAGIEPAGEILYALECIEPSSNINLDNNLGYDLKDGEFTFKSKTGLVFEASQENGSRMIDLQIDSFDNRIWIYGCSFLYGSGVPDSNVSAEYIAREVPYLKPENRAVPGYSSVQSCLKMIKDMANWHKGDYVVFSYASFHDERNNLLQSYKYKLYTYGEKEFLDRLSLPVLKDIKNSKALEITHQKFNYTPLPLRGILSVSNLLEQTRNGLIDHETSAALNSRNFLQEVASAAYELEVHFAFAFLTNDSNSQQSKVDLSQLGYTVIDLSMPLGKDSFSLLPLDVHPNKHAHMYYAEQIINWINEKT